LHRVTDSGYLTRYDVYNVGNERTGLLPQDRANPFRKGVGTQGSSRNLGARDNGRIPEQARGRPRNEAKIAIPGILFCQVGLE
jgi:hypothetical protein